MRKEMGVYEQKCGNWVVDRRIDGKRYYIGKLKSMEEANRACISLCNKYFISWVDVIEGEEWMVIPNTDKYYYASNLGRIKSVIKRNVEVIKSQRLHNGYWHTDIVYKGKKQIRQVHRLVMAAFYGESELHVNHKDGIRNNNLLNNLEYVTRKENAQHAIRIGLYNPKTIHPTKPVIRLADKVVYPSTREAARKNNTSSGSICCHCKGRISKENTRFAYYTDLI